MIAIYIVEFQRLKHIFLFSLIFLFIFNPGFRFFHVELFLVFIGGIICLLNKKTNFRILRNQPIKHLLLLLIIIIAYTFFIDIFFVDYSLKSLSIYNTYKQLRFLINYIFIVIPIVILLYKWNYSLKDFVDILIKVSILQAIIALLLFLLPDLKHFLYSNIVNMDFLTDSIDNTNDESFKYLTKLRLNGLGSGLSFGDSIFQGFALLLIFLRLGNNKSFYYYFSPLILFSIIVNARIGFLFLISYIVSLLVMNIYTILIKKKAIYYGIPKIIKITFVSVVLFIIIGSLIDIKMFYSIMSFMFLYGFSDGNLIPHQNALFGSHFLFPDNYFGFIFGEGRYVFSNPLENVHSDIGYSNVIMFGGLVYLVLMFFLTCFLITKNFKRVNDKYRVLFISIIIFLVLVLFKGDIFTLNAFIKTLFLLSTLIVLNLNNKSESLVSIKKC